MAGNQDNKRPTMSTPNPLAKTVDGWLRRYATQATIALTIVVGVTGVMMFFRLYKGEVQAMHEWLGLAFAAVALAHVVRHRQIFVGMLRQPRMRVLFAATAVASAAFIVAAPPKAPNPVRQATQAVMRAPLKDLAPVLGVTPEVLATRLDGADTALSIDAIAKSRGVEPARLLQAAMAK